VAPSPLVLPLVVLLCIEETGGAPAPSAAVAARSDDGSRKLSRRFDSLFARLPEGAPRSLLPRVLLALVAAAAAPPVLEPLFPGVGNEGAKGSACRDDRLSFARPQASQLRKMMKVASLDRYYISARFR